MHKIKFVFYCVLIVTAFKCNEDEFYSRYQVEDLWRVPLIKPYELRNVIGAKKESSNNDNWDLRFKKKNKVNVFLLDGLNVTMININNNVIYGYGTANPCYHFIIDCSTGEESIFEDVFQWKQTLSKLSIESDKLLDVFYIFEIFKNTGKTPWTNNVQSNKTPNFALHWHNGHPQSKH